MPLDPLPRLRRTRFEDSMTQQRDRWLKLAQLANFLDDLPHDKFHMPEWASENATEQSCGTAGCACGWAATVYKNDWTFVTPNTWARPALRTDTDGAIEPQDAFAEYFGIDDEDADWITCIIEPEEGNKEFPSYCDEYALDDGALVTPRHAADRIRKVLAKYDPTVLEERGVPALEAPHA